MTITMTKAAQVVVKATGPTDPNEKAGDNGLGPGQFKALVSVFNNVDAYGDVVMPGAFDDVLDGVIPVVWAHQWADVFAHIGHVDPGSAKQTDEGLEVIGTLDVDSPIVSAAEFAQQVHRLMAQGRISQFSFAFDVAEAGWGTRGEGDGEQEVFELRKFAALHEVGPCLLGVNRDTRLDDVKAVRAAYPRPQKSDTPEPPEPVAPVTDDGTAQEPLNADDKPAGDAPGTDPNAGARKALDPTSAALLADIAALD